MNTDTCNGCENLSCLCQCRECDRCGHVIDMDCDVYAPNGDNVHVSCLNKNEVAA